MSNLLFIIKSPIKSNFFINPFYKKYISANSKFYYSFIYVWTLILQGNYPKLLCLSDKIEAVCIFSLVMCSIFDFIGMRVSE